MGGKGGSSGPSQDQINQQAYAAGAGGQRWNDITGQVPFGHDQALQSWQAGQASARPAPMHGGGLSLETMMKMMSHSGGESESDSSYEQRLADQRKYQEDQYAKQQAELRRQEQERLRIEGLNQRDAMYSNYMDAVGSATDYVNAEVDKEMANARLLGIDYELDDEMKTTRISDYFASIWGEGEQAELEALFGKWGKPKGFSEFMTRGDGSVYAAEDAPSETGVAVATPIRPTPLDDEETLGAGANVLGV